VKNIKGRNLILFLFICFLIFKSANLSASVPGDFDGDCVTGFKDFAILALGWLTESGQPFFNSKCDISNPSDGMIDDKDLAVFGGFWLNNCLSDMVLIPAGTFQMGDNFSEGFEDELPVHTATLDSFYMSRCEITNSQFCQFLNSALDISIYVSNGIVYGSVDNQPYCDLRGFNGESQIDFSGGDFSVLTKGGRDMSSDPVVLVSWFGAAAYCNWRSNQEGREVCYDINDPNWTCDFSKKGFRLPTEAEWEYAARGNLSGKRFPWGDTISHNQANYYSWWNEGQPFFPYDISLTEGHHPDWNDGLSPFTSPSGSFPANGFGLYDMAGNVWEWCNDWYDSTYYASSPLNNPKGPSSGTYRTVRGGGWNEGGGFAFFCRNAYRTSGATPDSKGANHGFRIVLRQD